MGYSYAVNSEGTILNAHTIKNPISIASLQFRQKELMEAANIVSEVLQYHGVQSNPQEFDYIVQPFYLEDRLIFFTKQQIEASDSRVRQSALIHSNPDYHFNDARLEEQLRSIFSVKENYRNNWYILSVESFVLERNFVDKEYIHIQAMAPMLYHSFIESIPKIIMSGDEAREIKQSKAMSMKYIAISPSQKSYMDANSLIANAVVRDKDYPKALLDKAIEDIQVQLCERFATNEKDKFSNQKMICLHQINDCKRNEKSEFAIYERLKRFLKREFPGTNGICYKENAVYFRMPNRERGTVFIINPEKEHFNAGGIVIKGFDNLREAFKNDTIFKETEWFDAIKPYVIEKEKSKQDRMLA